MTKRSSSLENNSVKKQKLYEDINSLWGDDVDENALDDCIKRATQLYQEEQAPHSQLNNVSILPTYNAFKEPTATIFSSTQLDKITQPCTSKYIPATNNLEKELARLRQQHEEKEGEVTILRSQLRETKVKIQTEHQKLENEWKQRLGLSEKQIQSIKSELEFKNLEIANLKQKMLDITKHAGVNAPINSTQNIPKIRKDKTQTEQMQLSLGRLYSVVDPVYPLSSIMPDVLFNVPQREKCVVDTKVTHFCRNAIPYLQNQTFAMRIAVEENSTNIDVVYPEVLKLINCSEEHLNSEENIKNIDKIVCASLKVLEDLHELLKKIRSNLRTEDILEIDCKYVKSIAGGLSKERDEIGIKSGIMLNFLAELLPYSSYLQKCICQHKAVLENESFLRLPKKKCCETNYLHKLLDVLKLVGEMRKANIMSKFLCSSIRLLINICKTKNYHYVSDVFCNIIKELIFMRPASEVICEMTLLFNVASGNPSFVNFLFNKMKSCSNNQKGIIYFNEGTCRFYIFVLMFDNSIFKLKEIPLSVCLNMLCFVYNTYKSSYWIHHQDNKKCDCLLQLYKLEMEIIFTALEMYVKEFKKTKSVSNDWNIFFKHPVTSKILNLMVFNCYELMEKYVTVFSQYREIEKQLQDDKLCDLEKLNINEEVLEISSNAFNNINF